MACMIRPALAMHFARTLTGNTQERAEHTHSRVLLMPSARTGGNIILNAAQDVLSEGREPHLAETAGEMPKPHDNHADHARARVPVAPLVAVRSMCEPQDVYADAADSLLSMVITRAFAANTRRCRALCVSSGRALGVPCAFCACRKRDMCL